MCDKELLLGYLYDELPTSDRQAFDRHLATCADCRAEVDGLRGTRAHLTSWAPPEPDLGLSGRARPEAGRVAAALVAHVACLGPCRGGAPHRGRVRGHRQPRSQGRGPTGSSCGPGGTVTSRALRQATADLATSASASNGRASRGALEGAREPARGAPGRDGRAGSRGRDRMSDAEIVRYVRQPVSDERATPTG